MFFRFQVFTHFECLQIVPRVYQRAFFLSYKFVDSVVDSGRQVYRHYYGLSLPTSFSEWFLLIVKCMDIIMVYCCYQVHSHSDLSVSIVQQKIMVGQCM